MLIKLICDIMEIVYSWLVSCNGIKNERDHLPTIDLKKVYRFIMSKEIKNMMKC